MLVLGRNLYKSCKRMLYQLLIRVFPSQGRWVPLHRDNMNPKLLKMFEILLGQLRRHCKHKRGDNGEPLLLQQNPKLWGSGLLRN